MTTAFAQTLSDVLQLQSFAPSDHVNQTMSSLVASVIAHPDSTLPSDSTIMAVRRNSAAAEAALELFWSKHITSSSHPIDALSSFPYRHNYAELVRRELAQLSATRPNIGIGSRVLIIGSGPLPLTAYEIAQQTGAAVDQLDIDRAAVDAGRAFCDAVGMESVYLLGDGQSTPLTGPYDAVLIAALAGESTDEKQAIVDNVVTGLGHNGRIVLRSAKGTRTLLYPEIKEDALTGVTLLASYHPDDEIINSVLIYGAPA